MYSIKGRVMKTVLDFFEMKQKNEKIAMLTCYDYCTAQIINASSVDCVLVGDSVAMVMHGHDSTVTATMDMMALHTEAVSRGATDKFIIADLPFLSYRKGLRLAMENVERLMQSGAQAVKLEGAVGNIELVRHVVDSGIPVMGHIGLTPQSIHQMGGWKIQGKESDAQKKLLQQANALQEAGCFSVVVECVPAQFAKTVTDALSIPTIGIGAGAETSGQVLVLQDMLGMNAEFKPKFLKQYMGAFSAMQEAVNEYVGEVKAKQYPAIEQSYQ